MEIILNHLLLLFFFFSFLHLSNTRDLAVVTAGGLFSNQTLKEDADARTFLASLKIF